MDNSDLKRKAAESSSVFSKLTSAFKKTGSVPLTGLTKSVSGIQKAFDGLNVRRAQSEINSLGNGSSLRGLQQAIDTINSRFSVMGEMAARVYHKMADGAMAAGKAMVNNFGTGPVRQGFGEYELNQNSIKAIMANVEGANLKDVNATLDELNDYADKTVYSFGDMTNAIGRFTAAGVGLKQSTTAIKGLSNLAASGGASTQDLAHAYIQISQALGSGVFRLMDWNSIQNANLNTKKFRDALQEAAIAKGTLNEKMEDGKFRESLSDEWLTTEVFMETLDKFANDPTMLDAATKVRTFTQLVDTLKESIGSGWAQSFRALIGDFEQATNLFTGLNDIIGKAFERNSDKRNKMLKDFVDMGGRDELIKTLYLGFESLSRIMKVVGGAWREVFPPTTATGLLNTVRGIKDFVSSLIMSSETMTRMQHIFRGVFSAISSGLTFVKELASAFGRIFTPALKTVLTQIAMDFASLFIGIDKASKAGKGFVPIIRSMGDGLAKIGDFIAVALAKLRQFVLSFKLDSVINSLKSFGSMIKETFNAIFTGDFTNFDNPLIKGLGTAFRELRNNIVMAFQGLDLMKLLTAGGLLAAINIFKKIKDGFKNFSFLDNIIEKVKEVADNIKSPIESITESFGTFINTLKGNSLPGIAISIGILAVSLNSLSKINIGDAAKSIIMLSSALGAMILVMKATSGLKFSGGSFFMLASSISMIASSVKKLSGIDPGGLMAGVAAISGLLAGFALFAKVTQSNPISKNLGNEIFMMSIGLQTLAMSIKLLGSMEFNSLVKGIFSVASGLTMLVGATALLSKIKAPKFSTFKLIGLSVALMAIAAPIKMLGSMDIRTLAVGIGSVAAALSVLVVASQGLKYIKFQFPAGLLVMVASIQMLIAPIETLGKMNIERVAQGVLSVAAALAVLTVASNGLKGFKIINAAGLMLLASAVSTLVTPIRKLAFLSIESLAKAIGALGITLGGLMLAMNMGASAGAQGLILATGLAAMGLAMTTLLPSMLAFSALSWGQIVKGIGGFALALGAIAGVAGVIGVVAAPGMIALAAGIGALGLSLAGVSLGIATFGAAIGVVGAAVLAFAASFNLVATGIHSISQALPLLNQNLAGFVDTLSQSAASLGDLFVTLVVTVVQSIAKVIVQGLQAIGNGVMELINYLVGLIPEIISAASRLFQGLIIGLAQEIPKIVETAIQAGIALIAGLANGIAQNSEMVMDALGMVIDALIVLVGEGIYKIMESLKDIPFIGDAVKSFRGALDDMKQDFETKNNEIQKVASETAKKIQNETKSAADSYEQINSSAEKTKGFMERLKETFDFSNLKGLSAGDALKKMGIDLDTYGPELTSKFGDIGKMSGDEFTSKYAENMDLLSPELQASMDEALGKTVESSAEAGSEAGSEAATNMWDAWKSGLSLEEFIAYGETLGYNFSHGLWQGNHITDAGVEMMKQLELSLGPEKLADLGDKMGYDLSGGLTHMGGQYVTEAGAELVRRLSQGLLSDEELQIVADALGLKLGNAVSQSGEKVKPQVDSTGRVVGDSWAGSVYAGWEANDPGGKINQKVSESINNIDTSPATTKGEEASGNFNKGAESVDASAAAGKLISSFANAVSSVVNIITAQMAGQAMAAAYVSGIEIGSARAAEVSKSVSDTTVEGFRNVDFQPAGDENGKEFIAGIESTRGESESTARSVSESAKTAAASVDFTPVGTENGNEFVSGIQRTSGDALSAGRNVALDAKEGMEAVDAYQSGVYLVQGFANGISGSAYLAWNAAMYAANQARQAIDWALGIASPAKKLIPSGMFTVMGFAKGISDNASIAEEATTDMAKLSVSAIGSVVDKELDDLKNGITIEPQIIPVFDGSNIPDNPFPNQNGIISAELATRTASSAIALERDLGRSQWNQTLATTSGAQINNKDMFNGAVFNVREDSDIERIASEVDNVMRRNFELEKIFNLGKG